MPGTEFMPNLSTAEHNIWYTVKYLMNMPKYHTYIQVILIQYKTVALLQDSEKAFLMTKWFM